MHHTAASTPQSWSASSTLPAAWARSHRTVTPAACPAAVNRSMSRTCPVAKLTPARTISARSGPWSRIAAARSSGRRVASPVRGATTTRSAIGSSPREARWLVSACRSDGKSGASTRIRRRRPAGRKNDVRSSVEVDRQRVEDRDLRRPGTHDPRHRFAQRVVLGEPRPLGGEPAIDAEAGPAVEHLLDRVARRPRLQAERLAREVDRRRSVRTVRSVGQQEAVPHRRQRIRSIAGERLGFGGRRSVAVAHGRISRG